MRMRFCYATGLFIALLLQAGSAMAQEAKDSIITDDGKRYHLHVVRDNETLFSISKHYGVPVDSIRQYNLIEGDAIKLGRSLRIPAWLKQAEKKEQKSSPGSYRIHRVERKETLYSIAQQYGVTMKKLVALNPGVKKGLKTGQEIKIPREGQEKEDMTRHTVEQGETLFALSQQYNVKIARIRELNPEVDENGLKIGQVLTIPEASPAEEGSSYDDSRIHTVAPGETLYAISEQYHISIEKLKAANPVLRQQELEEGQKLKVPKPGNIEFFPGEDTPSEEGTHIVRKGETLYSLSKEYDIPIDSLLRMNPEARNGVKVGQELFVGPSSPKGSQEEITPVIPDTSREMPVTFHEVQQGEGLDAIAQQYHVPADVIEIFNPSFWFRGLHPGQILIIPRFSPTRSLDLKRSGKKQVYTVALFLPFKLNVNDSIMENTPPGEEQKLHPSTRIALEFYNGIRLALDSLQKVGLSVDLHVFESRRDSTYMNQLFASGELEKADLFIGPLYSSNLKIAANFAKRHGIHTVCPVPQSNRILLGNPNISKVDPSRVTMAQQLARRIARKHSIHNVVLMDSKSIRDQKINDVFRESFNKYVQLQDDQYRDSLRTATMEEFTIKDLMSKLAEDTLNILVVPSQDKVFASDLLTRLNNMKEERDIIIYGLEDWLGYESIDIAYKHQFRLHVATDHHIDHDAPETMNMIRRYRKVHATDPDRYAFLGYDIGLYYFTGLLQFGLDFPEHFDQVSAHPLHIGFDYYKTGVQSGYENQHIFILRYEDYDLKRQNTTSHVH